MEVYIVTGASKGIGKALMDQLEHEGHIVYGLARRNDKARRNLVKVDVTADVATIEVEKFIKRHLQEATSFTLINNAGIVEPIGLVGLLDREAIARAIEVNVTAPIQLANAFISALQEEDVEKRIMNISSGAGRKQYDGWGVYGTTKAALDHFSTIVHEEQKKQAHPVQIVSIAPGIIDTNMQEVIRSSDESHFPLLEHFIDYKETGALATPEETAARLLTFLRSEWMNERVIADVRDVE